MQALKSIGWFFVNLFQAVWLAAFSFISFILVMLLYAITWNPDAALSVARTFWGPINLFFGFSKVVIEGRENIPLDRPYILMMNHQSIGDILVAWLVTPTPGRFVAKHVLRFVPVVGWTLWIFGMVSIDRGNAHASARALKKAARLLAGGRNLVVFPEGTRSRDGKIAPFKRGVFLLAKRAGVDIIPVAVEGVSTFVPVTRWNPRPVTIRVQVGKPIASGGEDEDRDTLIRHVRDTIIDMHLAIGGVGGDKSLAVGNEARQS